jgi:hypothetical protein
MYGGEKVEGERERNEEEGEEKRTADGKREKLGLG